MSIGVRSSTSSHLLDGAIVIRITCIERVSVALHNPTVQTGRLRRSLLWWITVRNKSGENRYVPTGMRLRNTDVEETCLADFRRHVVVGIGNWRDNNGI